MKTKRITALALSLVMALACLPAWAVSGISVLYMYLLGMHEHFVYYDFNADVDGDGEVDFTDVNELTQILLTT